MLNLRQTTETNPSVYSNAQNTYRVSTLNFRVTTDRLGNIGEFLDTGESLGCATNPEDEDDGRRGLDIGASEPVCAEGQKVLALSETSVVLSEPVL